MVEIPGPQLWVGICVQCNRWVPVYSKARGIAKPHLDNNRTGCIGGTKKAQIVRRMPEEQVREVYETCGIPYPVNLKEGGQKPHGEQVKRSSWSISEQEEMIKKKKIHSMGCHICNRKIPLIRLGVSKYQYQVHYETKKGKISCVMSGKEVPDDVLMGQWIRMLNREYEITRRAEGWIRDNQSATGISSLLIDTDKPDVRKFYEEKDDRRWGYFHIRSAGAPGLGKRR